MVDEEFAAIEIGGFDVTVQREGVRTEELLGEQDIAGSAAFLSSARIRSFGGIVRLL